VARVVVDVMLKPEILDPQGRAIAGALPRLGFGSIRAVLQGKRFELEVDGELTEEVLDQVQRAAGTLLSNPVIEDFAVRVEEGVTVGPHAVIVPLAEGTQAQAAPTQGAPTQGAPAGARS